MGLRTPGLGSPTFRHGVAFAAIIGLLGACSPGQAQQGSVPSQPPGLQTALVADGRFTVFYWTDAIDYAQSAGHDLMLIVQSSLEHIDKLLPGPRATVFIEVCDAPIAETGTCGVTAVSGLVSQMGIAATSKTTLQEALQVWLPRTIAHEVDHEVRIQSLPAQSTLLQGLILEGTADAFDNQAFPGQTNPWDVAITPSQEHALWSAAQPELNSGGLYQDWMFGDSLKGIPHWAGFTIGYHIVTAYLLRHPATTASALAKLSAASIMDGSGYSP
jgi:hypothetical protein